MLIKGCPSALGATTGATTTAIHMATPLLSTALTATSIILPHIALTPTVIRTKTTTTTVPTTAIINTTAISLL